jgi:hypothetical protein
MPDAEYPAVVSRVLITGSRTWPDDDQVLPEQIAHLWLRFPLATLVHGGCPKGADGQAGRIWAKLGGTVEVHEAQWDVYGRSAGMVRNTEMVRAGADLCLAFILRESTGALMCARSAEMAGIPVWRFTEPRRA